MERTSSSHAPASSEVEAQLERILASDLFRDAERLREFLRFSVIRTLEGEADAVKETTIGVEVFSRPSFESDRDSIVRSSARRLRARLQKYYETAGQADPVLIHIPTGTYIPQFSLRARSQPPAIEPVTVAPKHFRFGKTAGVAGVLLLVCFAGAAIFVKRSKSVRHIPPREAVELNSKSVFESTHGNFTGALDWYRRAAVADANFDLAQIGLANSYGALAAYNMRPGEEALPLAEKAALRAIQLSPGSGQAHGALGFVRYCQWRWAESDHEFQLAKQLAPNDAVAWRRWINVDFAYGRFEHAEKILGEAGHPREALDVWRPMSKLYPRDEGVGLRTAEYEYANGDDRTWKTVIAEASKRSYLSSWVLCGFYIRVDERKTAMPLLERAAAEHNPDLISVRWDPIFDSVRNEPAYKRVVKQLGF